MEKTECAVSDDLCNARMKTEDAKIDGIKDTIKMSVTIMGVALAIIEVVLRFI